MRKGSNTHHEEYNSGVHGVTGTVLGNEDPVDIANLDNVDEQSFINLLENGNVDSWSAGASAAPDGWTYVQSGAGGGVARVSDTEIATYVARLTKSDAGSSVLRQDLTYYNRYKEREVSFYCLIKSANSGSDKISTQIADGVSTSVVYYQNSGNYELIKNTLLIDSSATHVRLQVVINTLADSTVDFVGLIAVEGSICPVFSSKPIVDDGHTLTVDSINNRVGINNTTPSEAFDVSGNIAVTGTVDGRDVNTDGIKLDGLDKNVANGVPGLDASADILLAQIPDTLTGKDADTLDGSHGAAYMKRVPDYDSGCFSLAATSYVEKTHNLGTRDLIIQVLWGFSDTDCSNDGTSGTGRPIYNYWITGNFLAVYASSINKVEVFNDQGTTAYFRLLIWKAA